LDEKHQQHDARGVLMRHPRSPKKQKKGRHPPIAEDDNRKQDAVAL
jgi:hypothetical protein